MYKLYGHSVSNYFNMLKHVLLEKGLDYEVVYAQPGHDASFLESSPMGKIPTLETPRGFISETIVAIEYLEETHPVVPVYPMEPFEKAKARRLVHIAEVYIDTPARDILMKDFVQFSQSESRLEEIQQQLQQAAGAVAKLAPPSPWMMGEQFTIADIFLYYTLLLMMPPVEKHTGVKLLDLMPGYSEWFERFSELELSRKVAEPLEEDWARFGERIERFLTQGI